MLGYGIIILISQSVFTNVLTIQLSKYHLKI